MINVRDFLDDKQKLNTQAFQKAIDLGSDRGGETVFVPYGEYKLSTVILKSNTNLVFEDGVKIYSSEDLDDFLSDEPITFTRYQDLSHSSYTKAMFYANEVENVSIRGLATIDMLSIWDKENKRSAKDGFNRGAKVFSLKKVNGLRLYDVKILNATDIAVLMGGCKDVIISKLYISSHIDGISPDCCEDVNISDCIIKTGDDALVFKTSYFDNQRTSCQRINVTNCTMSSRCNAIKFGTESVGDFKYINVSNCSILNTQHSGIAIESADGANIYGINISNVTMCNVANPIFIYCGDRLRAPQGTPIGSISNVTLSNIFADVNDEKFKSIDYWYPAICEGSDYGKNCSYTSIIMSGVKEKRLNNITLDNVHLKVLGGGKKTDEVKIPASNTYPDCVFFRMPCYGLYVENVDNLRMENFTCECKSHDEREKIIIK